MALRSGRDWTVAEMDAWGAARQGVREVMAAAAEEGGPRVSLVPDPVSLPLDFLPDVVALPVPAAPPCADTTIVPFHPEPSRKTGGWSAARQRVYIETLAESGSVHLAAKSAGLSARSAYALRVRSPRFAAAWDAAQQLAVGRLSALAFDRAIHGRVEQIYHHGELVGERRVPSERLLMWLLARLDPARFAAPSERGPGTAPIAQADVQAAFPALLDGLADLAAD